MAKTDKNKIYENFFGKDAVDKNNNSDEVNGTNEENQIVEVKEEKNNKLKQRAIYLYDDEAQKLKALAMLNNCKISDIVRLALTEYFESIKIKEQLNKFKSRW